MIERAHLARNGPRGVGIATEVDGLNYCIVEGAGVVNSVQGNGQAVQTIRAEVLPGHRIPIVAVYIIDYILINHTVCLLRVCICYLRPLLRTVCSSLSSGFFQFQHSSELPSISSPISSRRRYREACVWGLACASIISRYSDTH
jgi:hypothetical protein